MYIIYLKFVNAIEEYLRGLLGVILSYLDDSPARQTTENLVTLGIITYQQYNEHWMRLCPKSKKKLSPKENVDFGWMFCILFVGTERECTFDLNTTTYTKEELTLHVKGIRLRISEWYKSICSPLGSNKSCPMCFDSDDDIPELIPVPQPPNILFIEENYPGLGCRKHQKVAEVLQYFFDMYYEINLEMINATISYIYKQYPRYVGGGGCHSTLSIAKAECKRNNANPTICDCLEEILFSR